MIPEEPAERWEQLEHYLTGRMEKEQSRQLQERMETDEQLADELTSVRLAQGIVMGAFIRQQPRDTTRPDTAVDSVAGAFIEQQMRDTLRQIRAGQLPGPVIVRNRIPWRRVAGWVAAACLLLVGYLSVAPVSLPNAGYDVLALRSVDTTQLLPEQRVAFGNFFDGQARMLEGDYVQAARHFENVLTVDDLRPYFREAAEWHLAVSYLKSHQISRASQLYQRLRVCNNCAYEVGWLNRKKMEWQLLIADWLP